MDKTYFEAMEALLEEIKALDYKHQYCLHHIHSMVWEMKKNGATYVPLHMSQWFVTYAKLDFDMDVNVTREIVNNNDTYGYEEWVKVRIA